MWGYDETKLFRKIFTRERRLSERFSITKVKPVSTELAAVANYL